MRHDIVNKTLQVIESCITTDQLNSARRYADLAVMSLSKTEKINIHFLTELMFRLNRKEKELMIADWSYSKPSI